jgi:hypothetical protein
VAAPQDEVEFRSARRRSSTLNFSIPYPRPQDLAYLDRVVFDEGRFLEALPIWLDRLVA